MDSNVPDEEAMGRVGRVVVVVDGDTLFDFRLNHNNYFLRRFFSFLFSILLNIQKNILTFKLSHWNIVPIESNDKSKYLRNTKG